MPKDIELSEDQSIFTATVTYDTRGLYGEVTGSCEIVVAGEKSK